MNNFRLDDLFLLEELRDIGQYEETFGRLVAELEKKAIVAERYPVSFKINGVFYSFPDKETLTTAIEDLKKQYDECFENCKKHST